MADNLQNQKYDVIIVGTGPGGATTAKELTSRGKKVLMLEWGPGGKVRGTFRQYFLEQLVPGNGEGHYHGRKFALLLRHLFPGSP
jgi:choline dehydrogenase-like flavoprotein